MLEKCEKSTLRLPRCQGTSRFLRQRFGTASPLRRVDRASSLLVRVGEELVRLGGRGLDSRRRAQKVDGRRRPALERENPAEEQVCPEVALNL